MADFDSDTLHALENRLIDALERLDRIDSDEVSDEWVSGFFSDENDRRTELDVAEMRTVSRRLLGSNPFAVSAVENRVNFVIGKGHRYRVLAKSPDDDALASFAQELIDDFLERNRWHARQQEIMRRNDRDGESFLRFFTDAKNRLCVRFVEPEQITRTDSSVNERDAFGILSDPNDAESVIGYYVENKLVPAASIDHRKQNVDSASKRGLPLLWPVRKNLNRAEKLLRNMSVVAEIQSAIALIRKHANADAAAVNRYLRQQYTPKTVSGENRQRFAPGTVIDAGSGIDYQFPIAAVDASRYINILQAELRAVAARLVMPEFMLTSDASNSNYASTLVAEGPAVRMFERLQTEMIRDDLAVMRRVLRNAVTRGLLPNDVSRRVLIGATPPTLAVRDRLSEAKADEILLKNGVLSRQTMAMRHGLDPNKEVSLEQ